MKSMLAILRLLLVLVGVPTSGHAVNQVEPIISNQFIGGTVERIDMIGLRLTVQTDLGHSEALPVASVDVIKNLNKGDRVSAELDDQGLVVNIVKTAPSPNAPRPRG
jgi:hypothetical protein